MAMTATSTRSTRRAEGPVQRATRLHNHSLSHSHGLLQPSSNSARPLKRLHEATNLTYSLKPAKKAKFEIEIPSKTQYQARLYPENIQQHHQHRPIRRSSVTLPHSNNNNAPSHDAVSRQQPEAPEHTPAPLPAPAAASSIVNTAKGSISGNRATKHNQKVVNGIRHELDRLQPSSADMANSNTQGRKLRSQEGVRYKSELSAYFPEYDEVIGNIPKEHRTYSSLASHMQLTSRLRRCN